jgi:hypothetical protein
MKLSIKYFLSIISNDNSDGIFLSTIYNVITNGITIPLIINDRITDPIK